MGDKKLYLLLLLSIVALSDAQDEEAQCLLAKRYRSFHKYEYLYEAESLNGLNGALNGPKASCKVEIEVPGTCHYVVRTKECTLSEVIDTDADGSPVFRPAAGSDNFKAEMEKNPLKVIVEGDNDIKLFPENDELVNILNIKRGIISALAVPVLEEERNKRMPTIFGLCKTDYAVNAREDIATDVTLTRDLSRCDNFRPIKDNTSPLAIITGMNYGFAQLFNSKQTCNYKFDNTLKHMTSGVCTENHLLLPFSHKETHGVTNVGKQTVSLVGVTEHNDRVFDHNEANMKPLHLDASIDMSPFQDENAILDVLRELAGLSQTNNGRRRAHLAQKLVSMMRKANAETLSAFLPKALEVSRFLTYQVLFQCGTPECSSAIMQFLRITESSTAEMDTVVYAMGLVPNPSRSLVKEMLEMAKYKPSKLIYYATSNAVRRLYAVEGKVTPEIQAAADYISEQIGDCTGDQESIYLTLRVTGNMAAAVGAASPALKSAVIQCISQPAATPKVQQAAIQVFRLTPIPEEGRTVLMQVVLDGDAPLQKRIAAYLILMKDPQPAELTQLTAALPTEKNVQAKSFFISHITSILSSTAPETRPLKEKILDALQGNEIGEVMNPLRFSRNYKIGSLQGNMIFGENHLPAEAMLEMTLNAFGYDFDMFEVGVEGKGFEPTVEALFGANGFFPDTVMKTIYFAADKMPSQVNQVLRNIIPELRNDRKKRQASQNIVREISQNVEKLIRELKSQDTPEAMLYLRLLGVELGYLEMKDIEEMAYAVTKVVDKLMKMFPTEFIKGLFSSTDNELFLHYMFMDNEFYLPTGPGVPLRVALSGTFTPGFKGGLTVSRDMSEISCMPSIGVEYVIEIGTHLPDYVQSGLEMHTSLYHERGLRVKLALARSQIKLTIPVPEAPSKLISITNSLYNVAGDDIKSVPAMTERVSQEKCNPIFPGLNVCGIAQFSNAWSNDASPFFPLSGDSSFEVELRPTGEVSEYTATIAYAHEEMVDKVTIDVKAEGTPTEATALMMFNRKTYTVAADLQIPEYIDVGFRIDAADPTTARGARGVKIDFLNNNVAQGSLVGLAKIDAMKEAMVQLQLLVPSLQTDAKMMANLKRAEGLILELESDIKIFRTSSVQNLVLKYNDDRVRAEIKSDVSSETESILPEMNAILDQRIDETGSTVRGVLKSFVEFTDNSLEASKIPFVKEMRVPAFPQFDVPKTLFMNMEAGAEYQFGKQSFTIDIPVPLGGKSSKDLNFPPALTTPRLAVPELGLELAPISVPIPEIIIPDIITLTPSNLGMAEVSGKFSSNLYNMEATASAGRDPVEDLSYSAKLTATGTGPVDILTFRVQGSALLSGSLDNALTAELNTDFNHKLIDVRVNVVEEIKLKEISMRSSSKFIANSPLGVEASLEHTGQLGVRSDEISGDSNLKGSFVTGPVQGDITLEQSLALFPFRPEGRIQSTLKVDSTALQAENYIIGTFANGELSVQSNTGAFGDRLTHAAEVTFMQSRFAIKSDTKALALGMTIQNIAEAGVGARDVNIRFETTTDSGNHAKSLIFATLNDNGLVVNCNASSRLAGNTAIHRSKLTLNKKGLVTSGTTNLKSPLNLRNTFTGSLDYTKASLSAKTNGKLADFDLSNDISISASTSSLALACKSQGSFATHVKYMNDIIVQAEPYSASMNIKNDMKILPIQINNEAVFKAEPYKADLTGTVKVALDADELKHTYEIKYADLTATAKCSTTGKLKGTHMSHDSEIEIAGLSVRINNNGNFNSQPVRFSTTLQATAVPFSFNLNALANGDGELNLYGKQSAQVYTKILLKAEPLALAHSHECRISTKHEFSNDATIEMNLDNKVDTVLTPSEQTSTFRMKSKVNNNEISQDINAYNNDKRIGLEVSGVFTNIDISNQDFSLSGFLKYDKNTESHVISLPFIESLLAFLDEYIKNTAVTMIELTQNYIKREGIVDKIQTFFQYVRDVVTDLNLEEMVAQLKNDVVMFAQDCPITLESLEASVQKLKTAAQTMQSEVERIAKNMVENGAPVVQKLTEKLNALMEEYNIRSMLVAVIEAIENIIKQIDLMKLKDSSIAFLYNLNEQYEIKNTFVEITSELKDMVAKFNMAEFVEELKDFIISLELEEFADDIMDLFSLEEIREYATILQQLITELDMPGSCKIIFSNMKDVLVKYGVDKKIEEFLDKLVELIKQFKIDQTVQVVTDTLNSIQLPFPSMLNDAIAYLEATEIKDIIEDLNRYLEAFVQKIKSFDYNAFVDEANQKISEGTTKLNELIVSLEIPQKLEAAREFINYALTSFSAFFEELKTVKAADVMKAIDNVVLNNIKEFAETFKQTVSDIDLREQIRSTLEAVSTIYTEFLDVVPATVNEIIEMVREILGDHPFFTELKPIVEGFVTGLKTAEFQTPSFEIPFTNLMIPAKTFSMTQLQDIELPTQFELPEFTFLGIYTVPSITVRFEDFKQMLLELIAFITNFDIERLTNNAYFGELTLNYLPDLSAITLPEITIPDVSFPSIPKLSDEYMLNIPLQIPEIKLPKIPNAVVMPAFGKLYSEIRLRSPIYTLRTSAEIQNSTDNKQMHHFTAFLTSMGTSSTFPELNYNLDSTARIGIPRMSRLIIAETLKFVHSALTVEHQASVTFYGLSAQATAQTAMKANTRPYKADLINKAFFAVEGGMSASLETTYKHQVDVPFLSLVSEAALTQSVIALQKDATVKLTVSTLTTDKLRQLDYSDDVTYKSDLSFIMDLTSVKLTFIEDFDSAAVKIKDTLNVEAAALSHIDFNCQIETISPFIKKSLAVASGRAHLGDMKVEIEATHDTELVGDISGTMSNAFNLMIRPIEVVIDFQNKANAKANLEETLSAKIDLQNDYSVILNTQKQRINTVALMRFNQYKYNYNFTVDSMNTETGVYAAVNGETDLEFLNVPINIPEIVMPVFDFTIPPVNDLNLYEHFGLRRMLTTTKHTIDVDAKAVYKTSGFSPIFDIGLITVPAFGSLNSEASFKSSVFNINANAEVRGDDDFVIRIAATSTSVYEPLKAKLEGISRLSSKRALKLATALSLENNHVKGNHNSTMTLNMNRLQAAVAVNTFAKVNLPILTFEATHKLNADTKTQQKAACTLGIKYTYDLPIIKAVGSGDAEHMMKLDGTASFISAESTTKAMIDGTILENGVVKGDLDNQASFYINGQVMRSKLKTDGNINVNYADMKVQFDVDENLELEAGLSRVYTVMSVVSNNEVNIAALNTKGKHAASAKVDLTPVGELTADVELDLSQPSTFGDLTLKEKTLVNVTPVKQKITYTTDMVSPLYSMKIDVNMEGDAPAFKVDFKSSAKSPAVLLAYDLDSYISTTMENGVLSATAKASLEHTDFTMDFNNVITLSDLSQTLNMDITSPIFTDVNLRYTARRDGVSASVSTPAAGFLGFQLNGQTPSQISTRLYGRYASALDTDIEIITVRMAAMGEDKLQLLATYNLEAPSAMIMGLKDRLPSITSSITNFGDKYGICAAVGAVKETIVNALTEAFTVVSNHAPELSQLSVLFRNVVVQYQRAIQSLLDAAIKFLRETPIKLPGMEETTLLEMCTKIKSNVAVVLQQIFTAISENVEEYIAFNAISTVQLTLPSGDVVTGDQILDYVKSNLRRLVTRIVNTMKQLESFDKVLEKLRDTLQEVLDKAQEFVDTIRSDVLDAVALYVNEYYTTLITFVKSLIEKADALLTIDQLNAFVEQCMDFIYYVVNEITNAVSRILPTEAGALVKVQDGRLEIQLPFPFQQ